MAVRVVDVTLFSPVFERAQQAAAEFHPCYISHQHFYCVPLCNVFARNKGQKKERVNRLRNKVPNRHRVIGFNLFDKPQPHAYTSHP